MPPKIAISPPLLNTSSPWATTLSHLQSLYSHPSTGAVTTRTSFLTTGFPDDPSIHQHAFFPPSSSLNTYGYSPHPLQYYLDSILTILASQPIPPSSSSSTSNQHYKNPQKPFIISITGTPTEVATAISQISTWATTNHINAFAEINLSCPNIPGKPPPAYYASALKEYLSIIKDLQSSETEIHKVVPVGIKTPPYTYQTQFDELLSALEAFPKVVAFVTATNTLGSSLVLTAGAEEGGDRKGDDAELRPIISSATGTGVGGLAGESIHPLSLGNVFTIRKMLDGSVHEGVRDIVIIGAGGVKDKEGYARMKKVGAMAVGVGTAFGREGLDIFDRISGKEPKEGDAQ